MEDLFFLIVREACSEHLISSALDFDSLCDKVEVLCKLTIRFHSFSSAHPISPKVFV